MTPKFKDKTRGGNPVRIYATDVGGDYPIHGAVKGRDGTWDVESWAADGAYLVGDESLMDLIPVEEARAQIDAGDKWREDRTTPWAEPRSYEDRNDHGLRVHGLREEDLP